MHIPEHFAEPNETVLRHRIEASPLATLVIHTPTGLVANHLPFVIEGRDLPTARLLAHIPRANPLSGMLQAPTPCLAIFHGPDGYISPSWYATKKQHGKVVPTWNYAVVHVHGKTRVVDDPQWVAAQIEQLTTQNEMHRSAPWAVSDAPPAYTGALIRALVGIEVSIERVEGKTKASQNQPAENRASVLEALHKEAPDGALLDLMQTTND